ncbi:hypothetical protein U2F10_05540 [Leptothoe sp. EHU-05/26/07-4]
MQETKTTLATTDNDSQNKEYKAEITISDNNLDNSSDLPKPGISDLNDSPVVLKNEKSTKEKIQIAIDAEWDSKEKLDLCVQLSAKGLDKAVYLNSAIEQHVPPIEWNLLKMKVSTWAKVNDVTIVWITFHDDLNILEHFIEEIIEKDLKKNAIDLLLFYSPKDLSLAFGFENIRRYFSKEPLPLNSYIYQKRNIKGKIDCFRIHDLKGWSQKSLKDFAASVGYKMISKSDMDKYKSNMLEGLLSETEKFLDYAIGDADDLHGIKESFTSLIKEDICKDLLGFTLDRLPYTTGALVSKIFETWLYNEANDLEGFKLALARLGQIDTSHEHYHFYRKCWRALFFNGKTPINKKTNKLFSRTELKKIVAKTPCKHKAYGEASVKALAEFSAPKTSNTVAFAALVQGGRCNNEFPENYVLYKALDVDAKGCYSTSLSKFTYPIGLPSYFGYGPNELRITLRAFLDKYESELVDGLYTIYVSGNIKFCQDLIYSKLTKLKDIANAIKNNFPEDENSQDKGDSISHIAGEFALLRKQIENGIITADILNTIRETANNQQLKQLMDLEVICAVYYSAKDRVDTIDDWTRTILKSKGQLKSRNGLPIDNRCRAWVGIPIAEFISPLIEARNKTKAEKKNPNLTEVERIKAKAKDECLKLLLNTLYGVLASPYFAIGNTVIANNITARARLNTWMFAKALSLVQVITDGGFYSFDKALFLSPNGKLPGLDYLSSVSKLESHKSIKVGNLKDDHGNNLTWNLIKESVSTVGSGDIDRWATKHVNNFWANYGLELQFELEHKASPDEQHTSEVMAYWSKGHYAFKNIEGKIQYKIRGTKQFEDAEKRCSPMYDIFYTLLEMHPDCNGNVCILRKDMQYTHTSLQKIGKYLDVQNSKGYLNQKRYRPGDLVIEDRTFRLNNTHLPSDNKDQLKERSNRRKFKTIKGEKIPLEFYERFLPEGIDVLFQKLFNNESFHYRK